MSSQNPTSSDSSGALVPAVILFGGLTLLLLGLLASRPNVAPVKINEASSTTSQASAVPTTVVAEATEVAQTVAVALDPAKVKAGENSFQTICAACHNFNAMGIPGMGKSLIGSTFVNSQTDDELLAFLQVGRPITDPLNTTGVQMPARGGNPNFTDDKLMEIIAYIRSLNEGKSETSADATAVPAPTSDAVKATSAPFTQLDLSGLTVPTSISGGDTGATGADATAEPTLAPTAEVAATNVPFAAPDLSGLAVPTSISSGS